MANNPVTLALEEIKVSLVKPDSHSLYGDTWDWDRTEVAPDV